VPGVQPREGRDSNMADIEPDRPKHAILYAMLRWTAKRRDERTPLAPDVVVPRGLADTEGPPHAYGREGVQTRIYRLAELGLVEKVEYHGHTLGYRLTEAGIETIDELGVPGHYDH